MKKIHYLLPIITLIVLTLSCSKKLYTAQDLLGTWETEVDEPIDGKCTITFTTKKDGTVDFTFSYEDGSKYSGVNTDWKYENGIYEETYSNGTRGKAKIEWINKDKFNMVILENQATDTYKGRVRVYSRKKNKIK